MAEKVTDELIYEVLKSVQARLSNVEDGPHGIRGELVGRRGHMLAMQADTGNIYGKIATIESRMERVERRLDIIPEPAE